jgi:ligand-binding sensor domain-containing protein
LPNNPYSLLVSRDGTLWLGTYYGLVSWNGTELTAYPELKEIFVTSLLEARDGTVWAGGLAAGKGQLCEVRKGRAQCHGQDGEFGAFVWSLAEDSSGALWAGADTGLWRFKPGPPRRFALPSRVGDLLVTDQELLIGMRGAGLWHFVDDRLEPYPIRSTVEPHPLIPDTIINSNKLLKDRDGGIWIGTDGVGLHYVTDGNADSFTVAKGLSGDIACSLFEDREGNIWFASEKGLDRFRKLAVNTLWVNKGPASEITKSVLASRDGAVWVTASDGITRWQDGQFRRYRNESGLPAPGGQSLFEDSRRRIWVATYGGLAYFDGGRFTAVEGQPGNDVVSMTGDEKNLWLAGPGDLALFQDGRLVEKVTWTAIGSINRGMLVADRGGVWIGHTPDGGVRFFKDGKVRETYTPAEGLKGHAASLRLARTVCPAIRFTGRSKTPGERYGCTRPVVCCVSPATISARGSRTRATASTRDAGAWQMACPAGRSRLTTLHPSPKPLTESCGSFQDRESRYSIPNACRSTRSHRRCTSNRSWRTASRTWLQTVCACRRWLAISRSSSPR